MNFQETLKEAQKTADHIQENVVKGAKHGQTLLKTVNTDTLKKVTVGLAVCGLFFPPLWVGAGITGYELLQR